MSETNNGTDETPATGTEGGAEAMMQAVMADQVEDARERVRRIFDRANDKNAGRPQVDPAAIIAGVQQREAAIREKMSKGGAYHISGVAAADDPSDPTKPVLGTVDLIDEVVGNTQRYGAFAHWPTDKKAEVLGVVERVVKQRAIAQQVIAVARRDSIHARAYRERKKLVKEAERLVKAYGNRFITSVSQDDVRKDPALYSEGLNYLLRFAQKVADLPAVPEDEEQDKEASDVVE